MSAQKRKAEDAGNKAPAKKPQLALPSSVSVTHIHTTKSAQPVVASSPGVKFPDTKFEAYERTVENGGSDYLLVSRQHPTIDYTGTEAALACEKHLKHYLAVYDPSKNNMTLLPAKRMITRASIRQKEPGSERGDEAAVTPNYSLRAQLTETFGTKKSRKAVQSIAENRLLASGGDEKAVSDAILSSLAADGPDGTDLGVSQSTKPVPPANPTAEDISEVYPMSSLVVVEPVDTILASMPIQDWKDRIAAKKEVLTSSRFVANRVSYLCRAVAASPDNAKLNEKLQLLRYIYLMVEIVRYIKSLKRRARIPKYLEWPEKTISGSSAIPAWLVPQLIKRFFPNFNISDFGLNLLQTTTLAATLQIPPPSMQTGNYLVTEPTDITLDLGIDRTQTNHFFKELGCKMVIGKEAELKLWGLDRLTKKMKTENDNPAKTQNPKFAKLSFPIEFPKQSGFRPAR